MPFEGGCIKSFRDDVRFHTDCTYDLDYRALRLQRRCHKCLGPCASSPMSGNLRDSGFRSGVQSLLRGIRATTR